MEGIKYLAAIAAFPGVNTVFWQKTTAYFNSLEAIWEASISDFNSAGLAQKQINDFLIFRKGVEPEKEQLKLEKHKIKLITIKDKEYPTNLKEIFNPPFVLYLKGNLMPEDEKAIAIVGSRKATDYGHRVTIEIAEKIASSGVTVISGLALGLDAEAHKGALKGNGRTIAVLANGLDRIYPLTNNALAEKILENGAIISEQPIGMPPLKQNFPARNRIISGLSLGVLVVEASDHSGTLHTANFAIEQNRQVYAVPGPIYNPNALGPNRLLKMGAKAVTEANDILEDLGIEPEIGKKTLPETTEEAIIFEVLDTEPKHIDEITRIMGEESAKVYQILTMMEIKGKVKHLGGMVYALRR